MLVRLDFLDGMSEIKPVPDWVEFQGRLYVMREDGRRTHLEFVDVDKKGVRRYKEVKPATLLKMPQRIG